MDDRNDNTGAAQSLIAGAIVYTLPRIDALKNVTCLMPAYKIDNNLTENAIRPVAVGRKITCSPDHIHLHNMQPSSIHCLPLAKPK
ncbi:MAG: transposase [Chitinophagaceae bacterium]|nr:transposase [Chitinophagaceae bacterium]